MKEKRLTRNAIKTPDGTILESLHVHDYVTYVDENGEEYMVDGGLDYLRRNITKEKFEELSVYDDEPHSLIRDGLHWGTYGKNGDQPLKYKPIKDLTDNHITALLEYSHFPKWRLVHLENEVKYRKENNLKIEEE